VLSRTKPLTCFLIICVAAILASSCRSKKNLQAGVSNRERSEQKEYYAKKFGLSLDRESNLRLYSAIEEWYGVRYKYGSCSKRGIDCSCLVNELYREAYQCNTPRDTKGLYEKIRKIDRDELREGDLVFFKMTGRKVDHVGIYLSDGKFVHASTQNGVMISSLREEHFKKAFKTGGRLRCS
jgi:lipoprotein Spr